MKVKVNINTDTRGKYFIHKRKKTYIKSRCVKLMPDKDRFNVYVKEDGIKYFNSGGKKVYLGKDKETSKLICDDLDKVVKTKRKKINKVLTSKLEELEDVKTRQKGGKEKKLREVAKIAKLKIDEKKQEKKRQKEAKATAKRRSYTEVSASLEFLTGKRQSIKNEAVSQGWGLYQTQRAIREFDAYMANPSKPIETPALGLLYNKPPTFMTTNAKGLPTSIPDPAPAPAPAPAPSALQPTSLSGISNPLPIARPLKINELGMIVDVEDEDLRLTINNKDFDDDDDFMLSDEEEEEILQAQQAILNKAQQEGKALPEDEEEEEEEEPPLATPTLSAPVRPPPEDDEDLPTPPVEPQPRKGRGLNKPTSKKADAIKDAKQQIQAKLQSIQDYMDTDIRSANNYDSHIEVLKEPVEAEQRQGVFIKDAVKKMRADIVKQYKTYTKQLMLHFVEKYRKNPFKETTIAHYRLQGEVRRLEKTFGSSAPMNSAPQNIEDYDQLNTMVDYWKTNDNFRRSAVDSGLELMERKLEKFSGEGDKSGLYGYTEELVERFSIPDVKGGGKVALMPTRIVEKLKRTMADEDEEHFEAILSKSKVRSIQGGFELQPKYWKSRTMEHEVYETIAHNVREKFTTSNPELFGDANLTRAVYGDDLDVSTGQQKGLKMSASAMNLMTGGEDHATAPSHAGVEVEGGHIQKTFIDTEDTESDDDGEGKEDV